MRLTRFTEAATFYDHVAPFLLAAEAEHNLILGLCTDIQHHPERYEQQPYYAAVDDGGRVVLAALMTPPHNLALSQSHASGALELVLDDIAAFNPPGANGPATESTAFAKLWHERTGVEIRRKTAMRIYRLTDVKPVTNVPGSLRKAGEPDHGLLVSWFEGFERDAHTSNPTDVSRRVDVFLHSDVRALYLWEDNGVPVSMVGYSGMTPHSMRIVAVYTPPEHRRHGYASAAVAELSQQLLDSGREFVTLYTDLANPTSNHIYQEIGYQPVIDADEWHFADPATE